MTSYEKSFIKFQALYRGHMARKYAKKLAYDQAYRDNVAKEILKTERDYVFQLSVCIDVISIYFF